MTYGKEILWTIKSDITVAVPNQSFDTRKIFCNYSWKSNATFQILSWLTWLFPAASAARSFVCFKSGLFKKNTILHKTFRWTILFKLSSIYYFSTDPGVNDMGRNHFPADRNSTPRGGGGGGGTLWISGWGCAAGTLEPLTYARASSAEFCYPVLE